jgi:hypothetical protein
MLNINIYMFRHRNAICRESVKTNEHNSVVSEIFILFISQSRENTAAVVTSKTEHKSNKPLNVLIARTHYRNTKISRTSGRDTFRSRASRQNINSC